MRSLASYQEELRALTPEDFVQAFPQPVLLHQFDLVEEPPGFRTEVMPQQSDQGEAEAELTPSLETRVLALQKREGTLFEHRICVGRTRNNDLVLPYAKISKFHAYFTWSDDFRRFFLTDPGSTNGSYVDGERLSPLERVPMRDGTVVSFSRYHFRFHTPEGLYEAVSKLR